MMMMMMSSEYLDESDRYSQQQVDDDAAWMAEHASEERYVIEHGEAGGTDEPNRSHGGISTLPQEQPILCGVFGYADVSQGDPNGAEAWMRRWHLR